MYKIVFSATGRTEKTADFLCEKWDDVQKIDLSERNFEKIQLSADDLCLVAVSVYGGCVPAPAVENMAKIDANGAKAVIMAVYGNRAYDGALAQLKEVCEKSGFEVCGAVTAVAQHSMMPQVARTRPDETDRQQLSRWGGEILEKYRNGTLPQDISVPGQAPRSAHSLPVHPKADNSCVKCGLCAAKCPAGAIPQDNPSQTDNAKCITCMRCVEICPANSRKMMPAVMKAAGGIMSKVWGKHTENELFI